ncbi:MAG: hypothetical protein ACXVH3_31685 [Solirubrobacteraceae bacterium]
MAVAVITPTSARRGPRAESRRAFRYAAALPAQPIGVEVVAAVRHARQQRGRAFEWDARLETSVIAVLAYLWRRGRGEKWAGCRGSARYGCSLAQLVIGLAPIMGWKGIPDRGDEQAVARFVKRHRKSVQRWLDWLQLAGLVSHTPQQDEEGFWWRTIIQLHAAPQLPAELLQEAVERRAGWPARERRRNARGRVRNLTAILRRARLTKTQRRSRGIARRRELARHAERQRVRAQVAQSLADAAKTHVTHPFGASTTSRSSLEELSQQEMLNRRLTGARAQLSKSATATETSTTGTEKKTPQSAEDLRWVVYNEVKGRRFERTDEEWAPFLRSPAHRLEELLSWSDSAPLPRWRLIEAWTVAAHGPYMAVAGGFRLAFWSEEAEHHGPRLERALARYARYVDARPVGFPAGAIAAFARFLADHTPRQDGPEHGMAYDVQRFNELTKQMSAYAHYARDGHLQRAAARARRRARARRLAEQVNSQLQLRFRAAGAGLTGRLRLASELLDSDYPAHRAAGRKLYGHAKRTERLAERDERLRAGQHPGAADGRYRAACSYAERWGLQMPPGRWTGR